MADLYDEDSTYRRFSSYEDDREDGEFLKTLYPGDIMELQLMVEDKCDQLEYDGSIMFDEFPDKVRIYKVAEDIWGKNAEYDNNLILVLLINEMLRRRIRRRNSRVQGFC